MKSKIACILIASIFIAVLLIVTIFTSGTSKVIATDNFTSTMNVSLDFWNPLDIENSLRNAFLDVSGNFSADLKIALIDSANETLNKLVDPLVEKYIAELAQNQEDFFNSIEIFIFCILITGLAFWKKEGFLDCVAGAVDIYCGLMFAGDQAVSSLGWIIGVMIVVIGIWIIIQRIRLEINRILRKRAERMAEKEGDKEE